MLGGSVVGINHGGCFLEHGEIGFSLGFFNGPEAIQEGILRKNMVYVPPHIITAPGKSDLKPQGEQVSGLY
jgi:hypothetical protein